MSDNNEITARIGQMLTPYLDGEGLSLWGIELLGAGGTQVLRVFIDSPAGVDIEACAEVSRQLSLLLDLEDPIEGSYVLEVSSPGINRRFFSPAQLPAYLDKGIEAEVFVRREGRRRFSGRLTRCENENFSLEVDGKIEDFTWNELKKVRLLYEFPEAGGNGGKTSGS